MSRNMKTILLAILFVLAMVCVSFAGGFSFRDEFNTTTAAGSVNGTAAEPGPGNRTVVDTYASTELVVNGGFETVTSAGPPAVFGSWINVTGDGNIEDETTLVHGGGHAAKLTSGPTKNTREGMGWVSIPGRSYTVSFWTRGDGTNAGDVYIRDNTAGAVIRAQQTTGITGTTYANVSFVVAAPANCISMNIYVYAPPVNGGIAYFDDVSVLPTTGLLSIANGALTFAGGKASPAWGDPGYWGPSIVRSVGLSLIGHVNLSAAGDHYMAIGFDTNQTTTTVHRLNFSPTTLSSGDSSVSCAVGTIATGTDYYAGIFLRAVGSFNLLKTTTGNWKLLYIHSIGSTSPVYPSIVNFDEAFTSSFLRIPSTLWLPTPIASDSFATAFGTTDGLGHAETTGLGSGGSGLTWASGGSTWSVVGGKAINTPTLGEELSPDVTLDGACGDAPWNCGAGWAVTGGKAVATATQTQFRYYPLGTSSTWYQSSYDLVATVSYLYPYFVGTNVRSQATTGTAIRTLRGTDNTHGIMFYKDDNFTGTLDNISLKPLTLNTLFATVPSPTPDVIATVAITASPAGTQAGLVTNLDDKDTPAHFLIANTDGTNCMLTQNVNGTYTNLISATCTFSANAELRVIKDGVNGRLYYNNVQIGSVTNIDASITGTRHGLFSTYSGNQLDNFTVYARGTSNEYSSLDALMALSSGILAPFGRGHNYCDNAPFCIDTDRGAMGLEF